MKKEMTKEKPKTMFGEKEEEMPAHNKAEEAHEEHEETEHPEMDATGASTHKEDEPMHPALSILMNKLTEPEEEEPLMPHHIGGIKKNKK